MGRTKKTLLVAATAAAGVTAAKRLSARRQQQSQDRRRHVITVYRPVEDIRTDGRLPSPLADLGERVEIDMRPAPGDRGTEISVRARDGATASAREIRRALRDTQSLVEVGDVLLPSGPATTKPTLFNRPLRAVTRHGREEGLL